MTGGLRAFRLAGPGAAAALDVLHVRTDVAGAIEEDGAVVVWLAGPLPSMDLPAVTVTELPAEFANATATGLEHDRPIPIAPDLLVRPPWVARPPDFRGVELVVPRGMAFGSGEHASTQATLGLLHELWSAPASFGDIGTGSGILALYAHTRGCPRILACDVEAAAVAATRDLLPSAIVALGGPASLPEAADCVAANLTAAELHACLPDLLSRWTRRCLLVLGGMRAPEVAGVLARLPTAPWRRREVGDFTSVACSGQARPGVR